MMLITLACILFTAEGKALYEKHFNKQLKNADVFAVHIVKGIMDCEKLCQKKGACIAANVIENNGRLNCELIATLSDGFEASQLSPNQRGKFIKKQGK